MAQERSLPPIVERLWGREPVSRRGPRPRLDLATITAAAIEIADAEGLAGVSMASVASRVGVAATALYRYVGSKEDLLAAMADGVAPPPPEPEGMSWRDYLALWTRAQRDILLEHAWLLPASPPAPPLGPRRLLWLDRALAALDGLGLDDGEKINVASALTGYALTDAALIQAMGGGDPQLEEAGITGAADYGEVLIEVLDPETYPALSAAARAGAFHGAEGWVDDADFHFGLGLLLDGVEALIARRSG
ncbi:TetR/AcrR family transcriptional regulator C-terminal domain-containing protein [Nonomuraea sp. K274]|uniref:TetR/AcrR family transcriptional regulator C-terminal domain-containing protein n=1 Tax=Nonomuraea cypriaca TaxID=1187855 RepID=A0A931F3J4_9ACTN|nr:TetR/AcrR family transcriptional regulator [Nonomuraea cypriaca]MBF8189863.1 TetR/AcrR family transcriptional regulator C-terminal domain-containing protein [Nonomuraea cypriaca]